MKIIGLTSGITGNHDASAALLIDGKIVYSISEERITRIKHDSHFPVNSIKEVLSFSDLKTRDIDYFVSGAPKVNLLRFVFVYLSGFRYTSLKKVIQWFIARLALLANGGEEPRSPVGPHSLSEFGIPDKKIVYVPHYLAHAETAYRYSGMEDCLVVAWDGYGIDGSGKPICGTIYKGESGVLTELEDVAVYNSLALYYGAVTVALGFKLNDGEGKTMGLAVYGKESPAVSLIKNLFPVFEKGRWMPRNNWLEINGVSRPDYFRLTPTYRHLRYLIEEYGAEQVAFAAQKVLEEEGEKFFKYLVKKYKSRKVALAGGIFLNVKFNMKLLEGKIVDELFVYPNPGDGGIAPGAAIAHFVNMGGEFPIDRMESAYLGRSFTKSEIRKAIRQSGSKIKVADLGSEIYKTVAKHIIDGKVIGWFTGRDEWGPRALGARSVLADPRDIKTKDRINDKLKQRDWFMPFAPVILNEYLGKVLEHSWATPFMTLTDNVNHTLAKKIPAAIHIDETARAQAIKKETNFGYYRVVEEFYKITRIPVLLNTSFNKHGLPIVHTPEEAIEHLLWGCVDELVIENFLIKRK